MHRFSMRIYPRTRMVVFAAVVLLVAVATVIAGISYPLGGGFAVEAFAAPKQQRNQYQKSTPSSSSSSSSSFSSGGGGGGGGGGRKKKALGGNAGWYNKRKAGVKVQSRGPKPPKWEKEGDNLYVNHNSNNNNNNGAKKGDDTDGAALKQIFTNNKDITYEQARTLLRPLEGKAGAATTIVPALPQTPSAPISSDDNDNDNNDRTEKPFLWGSLSIGPVWKSRLVEAGYLKPTPIQVATYATLSNKKNQTSANGNAVIAASTGSGKSLAFLLPFLTSINTNNRKSKEKNRKQSAIASAPVTAALGRIWIMTPTMELAYQLQRTVDKVIVGDAGESSSSSDVLHVVEYNRGVATPKGIEEHQSSFSSSFPILSDIVHRYYSIGTTTSTSITSQEPTFLAGTPKLFVQLRKEIKKILVSTTKVDSNIRYAKQRQARKLREASEGTVDGNNKSYEKSSVGGANDDDGVEEQLLYRKVALALERNLQTLILDEVDRLLQTTTAIARREQKTTKPLAQELLEALVWESKKKPSRGTISGRKNGRPAPYAAPSYLTSTLQIVCASATIGRSLRRQLMYITQAPSMDKAAVLITADVRTKKNAELRKASLLPSNLKHSYRIVVSSSDSENTKINEKDASATATLQALVTTLQTKDGRPTPSLVFPGTIGVETVRDHLSNCGFRDIRGLSSLRGDSTGSGSDGEEGDSTSNRTPVYVVKERLARGLDLPEVKRVVLLGVPSNAAAYAHLAGRTARQNTPGDCIVLCKPSEAPKLVSIAEILGLHQWRSLCEGDTTFSSPEITESDDDGDCDERVDGDVGSGETTKMPVGNSSGTTNGDDEWDLASMTKTSIKSKKVSELREFLESKGVSTRAMLKDSLVDAVLQLKV